MKKTIFLSILTLVSLLAIPLQAQDKDLANIAEQAREFVAGLHAEGNFDGVILLAKNGKPFFHEAYGLASRRYNVPNKPDTKFNLGSMNKMFTAVAIGQLVEAGKLSFDDTVDKWLSPEWLSAEVGKKVTVGQLLNHTAGMGDYFNEEFLNSSRARFRELADYKDVMPRDLLFEPGSRFQYSNAGFFLAGVIIENASGQNYFEYIREHIYKPAGITDTDCYDTDVPVPNLAMGYFVDQQGVLRNNYFAHSARGGPAGGGFSTAPDQLKFAQALLENKLISAETRKILWTPKSNTRGYGYGFGTRDGWYGHNGGAPGISAWMSTNPESGFTIVAFANFGSTRDVYMKMRSLIDPIE